jgi:flagellar hook capping protein FlgD/N,N-dimethylformamidase beta subunit-like protein
MASPLVRVVFGVLVIATIAAFVVTQQLKSEFPLVIRFAAKPINFSPNGDGVRDRTLVGFDLSEPAEVSFSIVDGDGNEVRRLVSGELLEGDEKHRFAWDGRDDDGNPLPNGTYTMRVVRRDEGRVIGSFKRIRLDTVPPRVRLVSAEPGVIAPGEPGQDPEVRIRYRGPRNESPELRVFRTDDGPPRVVVRDRGDESRSAVWDGRIDGEPAPEGDYAFTFRVRDRAGNPAEAPAPVPTRRNARPGTGVAVRPVTLRGPLEVKAAGSLATLELGPFDRSFEFALSRLGDPRVIKRGGRIGGRFRVRIPSRARTGVYLVRVRAGDRRAVWPVAVAGLPPSRRAAGRPRPLVVLPAITWQGLNPVDDDLDGFADTLEDSRSVRLDREFRGAVPPPPFRREVAPLLRFLDGERLAYDLTTDIALARREGPAIDNAPGVVFAGSARWVPPALGRRMQDYVRDGGRVATLGADSLHRGVRLGDDSLDGPTRRRPQDDFGERTEMLRTTSAPMAVEQDDLGLFESADPLIGDFELFEQSLALPEGGRQQVAAGREPDTPAFIAYALGDGLVIRAGTPQWSSQLAEASLDLEVPRVTSRVWELLSEG